jgi:hypothetical protein
MRTKIILKKSMISGNRMQFNPPIVVQERKLIDMPWHKIQTDQEIPPITGVPTKRTPIKGNCILILEVTLFMHVT